MASISVAGDSSGSISIAAPSAAGSGVLTLPTGTDTLVGKATTDTLTNKSIAATQLTGTIAAARLPAGSVLQVAFKTDTAALATTSASYVASGTFHSITPSSATSKILVIISGILDTDAIGRVADCTIFRDSTNIGGNGLMRVSGTSTRSISSVTMAFLDSPSTTSSVTYSCYVLSTSGQIEWNGSVKTNTVTLMEIAG